MIFIDVIFFYVVPSVVVIFIAICIFLCVTTKPYPEVLRYEDEKYYVDHASGKKKKFSTSLDDDYSLCLSVIVPAYNEEERLPTMLDECLEYMNQRKEKTGLTYEIIVVSDGSTDNTVQVAEQYAAKHNAIKVLPLSENRGKGGAVRLGCLSASGSSILFADADGATTFADLEKLDESMTQLLGCNYETNPDKTAASHGVICGSRAHLEDEKEAKAKRSYARLVLMHGFHFLVWLLCVRQVRDTQCGFKLMTRESARILFQALHVERWAFDVELLYIAQCLRIPIHEVPVRWTEIEGSKLVPFWSWLQMARDLGLIWLRYTIGAWRVADDRLKSA